MNRARAQYIPRRLRRLLRTSRPASVGLSISKSAISREENVARPGREKGCKAVQNFGPGAISITELRGYVDPGERGHP